MPLIGGGGSYPLPLSLGRPMTASFNRTGGKWCLWHQRQSHEEATQLLPCLLDRYSPNPELPRNSSHYPEAAMLKSLRVGTPMSSPSQAQPSTHPRQDHRNRTEAFLDQTICRLNATQPSPGRISVRSPEYNNTVGALSHFAFRQCAVQHRESQNLKGTLTMCWWNSACFEEKEIQAGLTSRVTG